MKTDFFSSMKFSQLLYVLIIFITMPLILHSQEIEPPKITFDPLNKSSISGELCISVAYGERLTPARRGLYTLKEAMNRMTKVQTSLASNVTLSSKNIFNLPFLYVSSGKDFELTSQEIENLKKYFSAGGFMLAENTMPKGETSAGGSSLKAMLMDTVPNARFSPIPNNHQLYHCFFDFDAPPQGAEIGTYGNYGNVTRRDKEGKVDQAKQDSMIRMAPQVLSLEGVWSGGRLVAIYSDKGYIIKWNETGNNEPQLRMGVNMIIYALTQPGGMVSPR